jgi:hypothetical protein
MVTPKIGGFTPLLVTELDALRWTGRKGYGSRALIGACLVKSLYAIPMWSRTAALIAEHDALREALGDAPRVYACYRFATKLRAHSPLVEATLGAIVSALRAELPEYGKDIAIDASDLPAHANGQRFLSRNGSGTAIPMPRGATGARSARGKAAGSMAIASTRLSVPARSFRLRGASRRRERTSRALLMTSCREPPSSAAPTACAPPAPHWIKADRLHALIPRETKRWRDLYRGCAAVEREFGCLKHEWGLGPSACEDSPRCSFTLTS